jgi:hypothetical protein
MLNGPRNELRSFSNSDSNASITAKRLRLKCCKQEQPGLSAEAILDSVPGRGSQSSKADPDKKPDLDVSSRYGDSDSDSEAPKKGAKITPMGELGASLREGMTV